MRKAKAGVGVLVVAVVLAACAIITSPRGGGVVLEAQSVPFVAKAQWDPPAAAEGVVSYSVTLDGGTPIVVAPVVDPSCSCVQTPISIPTFGAHTLTVVSTNLLLSTDPASGQQTSGPATITFSLNRSPSPVTGGKIRK